MNLKKKLRNLTLTTLGIFFTCLLAYLSLRPDQPLFKIPAFDINNGDLIRILTVIFAVSTALLVLVMFSTEIKKGTTQILGRLNALVRGAFWRFLKLDQLETHLKALDDQVLNLEHEQEMFWVRHEKVRTTQSKIRGEQDQSRKRQTAIYEALPKIQSLLANLHLRKNFPAEQAPFLERILSQLRTPTSNATPLDDWQVAEILSKLPDCVEFSPKLTDGDAMAAVIIAFGIRAAAHDLCNARDDYEKTQHTLKTSINSLLQRNSDEFGPGQVLAFIEVVDHADRWHPSELLTLTRTLEEMRNSHEFWIIVEEYGFKVNESGWGSALLQDDRGQNRVWKRVAAPWGGPDGSVQSTIICTAEADSACRGRCTITNLSILGIYSSECTIRRGFPIDHAEINIQGTQISSPSITIEKLEIVEHSDRWNNTTHFAGGTGLWIRELGEASFYNLKSYVRSQTEVRDK